MSLLFTDDTANATNPYVLAEHRGHISPLSMDNCPPYGQISEDDNPRMENTIQKRIRERLEALDLTPEQASRKAGLDKTYLRKLFERPSASPRGNTLEALAKALDVDITQLISANDSVVEKPSVEFTNTDVKNANVNPPSRQVMPNDVPVLGTAAGSMEGAFQLTEGVIDYVRRPPALMNSRDIYSIFVEGSSMDPEHRHGDLRFINPHKPARVGDSVVIQIKNDGRLSFDAMIGHLVKRTATQLVIGKLNPEMTLTFSLEDIVSVHKVLDMNELFGV
ncbi:XRE family transcriptional regulator [Ochrobactrum chromiisoli]|uniref:Helix-turn-helix domain-containing protein n=1 Tax=Ochrobactrum chromiisoli TaxID=2993941 RepID=A0ABT3QL79_9HYPH|nr:helix-turn-helix domain-containing protein [Ochrobactrum chromiisoli]MCX2696371.1 helix-turn-helix domain-containing protein [Ochrobactrum chromiisoli]